MGNVRAFVKTYATADIEESWEVEMSPEDYARVLKEPEFFNEWLVLHDGDISSYSTESIGGEHDREFKSIEVQVRA